MLQELKEKAKELGIKGVHLYKSEEALQAKIDEVLNQPLVVTNGDYVSPFKEEVKEAQEAKVDKGEKKFKFRVLGGKIRYCGNKYKKGEIIESSIDLSSFNVEKV